MPIQFLLDGFAEFGDAPALVWRDREYSYRWLLEAVARWRQWLAAQDPPCRGQVVALEADFSPNATALMLALIEARNVVVPLTVSVQAQKPRFREIAEVERSICLDESDTPVLRDEGRRASHALLRKLLDVGQPGLVLFSSGSTGESKAALHDFGPILDKFRVRRHAKRMITFLLFDHIGGVNTLFYVLSNGGCGVTVEERTPDAVCAAIARYRVQVLPTSPTFLNLLLLSGALERHDLGSLELVTYGTEVMPESTLLRFRAALPKVDLLQTYGLSELGILRSKSRSPDSLWVKIGGEGFDIRVRDGLLEIRARSAMLGYLNAPSPFTEDGWFMTGDAVEVDGDYLRILGRKSEIINVGGEKVYPAEVETCLAEMPGVVDVAVVGEKNPITGHMVTATFYISTGESVAEFRKRMRSFCEHRLPAFKIPQKVKLSDQPLHGGRFKKMRH
jgi:acyl-coenzyme A synthetase/AMP-(fatty) acid ligase